MKLRTLLTIMVVMWPSLQLACNKSNNVETSSPPLYVHVGPNWDAIHNLEPSEKSFGVQVESKRSVKLGENLKLSVKSAHSGRLWIVQVDPDDRVSVLFPNQASRDNKISEGENFNFPPDDAAYSMTAQKPLGKSTLAAIVTTGTMDLDDILPKNNGMEKALGLIGAQSDWGVGHVVVDVTEHAPDAAFPETSE